MNDVVGNFPYFWIPIFGKLFKHIKWQLEKRKKNKLFSEITELEKQFDIS